MIPIAKPLMGDEEHAAVMEVLESGQIAQGPGVQAFEDAFAAKFEAPYAIATSSGTSALHVALLAHGIGPGDEVITTPFSFVASANAALFVGARPVFADIEPDYFTIDPEEIRVKITPKTKAIIAVHLYGQICDMDAITEIASKHDLIIIEDAAQAHGAQLNGQAVGSWGTACYSFYPTKNITTGEGGMITTHSSEIADMARMIRNHGARHRYVHEVLGYNLRMMDLQAAIGIIQLSRLDAWNKQRRANAEYLTNSLTKIEAIQTPQIRPGGAHVFNQYTLRVPSRDLVAEKLRENGIGTGIHYPRTIPGQPYYRELGYHDDFTHAESASREVLSIPVHPALSTEDLFQICDVLQSTNALLVDP